MKLLDESFLFKSLSAFKWFRFRVETINHDVLGNILKAFKKQHFEVDFYNNKKCYKNLINYAKIKCRNN